MFRKIFKKEKNKKELIQEINDLLREEKYDKVISKASLLTADSNQEIALEANLKIALAYFGKGNYERSLPIFKKIAYIKNDVESWFNVMTSAVLSRNVQKGKEAFHKALELQELNDDSQHPSVPQIRYFYGCALNDIGLNREALEQLDELKKIYMQLVITNDTFVYLRGIPFISQTLDLAKKVMKGLNIEFSSSTWLNELKEAVDEEGKEIIEQYCEA